MWTAIHRRVPFVMRCYPLVAHARSLICVGWGYRAAGNRPVLGLVFSYKIGETLGDVMFKPMLVDKGVAVGTIGLYSGVYGMGSVLHALPFPLAHTRAHTHTHTFHIHAPTRAHLFEKANEFSRSALLPCYLEVIVAGSL